MNPYTNTYKTQQIQTASREQILIMLYDGGIRFLNLAKDGLSKGDLEKFHSNITKTQRIITEFMSSLDVETGGEVARNLMQLYEYLHYRLIQANMKKDVAMVNEALSHLRELKKTWEQAIVLSNRERRPESGDTVSDQASHRVS